MTEEKKIETTVTTPVKAVVEGDQVTLGLAEFIELCNASRASNELNEANKWLVRNRDVLLSQIATLERRYEEMHRQPLPNVVVYKQGENNILYVQQVQSVQYNTDRELAIVIAETN